MVIMYQCRFIYFNESTSLVGDVNMEKAVPGLAQGLSGNPLYLLLSFAMHLKLL
jgi:hypothetical protein